MGNDSDKEKGPTPCIRGFIGCILKPFGLPCKKCTKTKPVKSPCGCA